MIAITISNTISIDGATEEQVEKIKKALTVDNLEYHKLKAMGKSVYGLEKEYTYYTEKNNALHIPRGCMKRLISYLSALKAEYILEEKTIWRTREHIA